jgi:hypothetical protein
VLRDICDRRAGIKSVGLEEEFQAAMQARALADKQAGGEGTAELGAGDSPLESLRLHVLEANATDVALLGAYWTEVPLPPQPESC